MRDITSKKDIQLMVDAFYGKVQKDELLSPVFESVVQGNWQKHLERMYGFWELLLLNNPGFKGEPFRKHENLPIDRSHFDQWLKLFGENMDELYDGPVAEDAKKRAKNIGLSFWYKIAHQRGL